MDIRYELSSLLLKDFAAITLKNSGGSVARRRSAAAKDADSATVLRINNFSTDSIMWRQRWKK